MLADAGKRGMLSTIASIFAECLYRQGRYDEADGMLAEAAEKGAEDDVATQVNVRAGRAKLAARRGDLDEAEALAREGVALAAETEFVDLRGDSLLALAEVLRLADREAEAAEALQAGTRAVGGEGQRRLRGEDARAARRARTREPGQRPRHLRASAFPRPEGRVMSEEASELGAQVAELQAKLSALESQVSTLQDQVEALQAQGGGDQRATKAPSLPRRALGHL